MTPSEAGFDGTKGMRFPAVSKNARMSLMRGTTRPSSSPTTDFTEQLVWLCPDDQPAQLLWCNADNQWFEVSFNPISVP